MKVNGRKKRGDDDDDSVRGEVRELREMVRDLVKAQKEAVTPSTGVVANRPENNIIPLETYNMGDNYGRYLPSPQPDYYKSGRDASLPTSRRSHYLNRRNDIPPATDYTRDRHEVYPSSQPNRRTRDRERRVPLPFNQNVDEATSMDPTRNTGVSNPEPRSIVGPNGTLYYPYRQPVVCFHCQEEGHIRAQCPHLNEVPVRVTTSLGPDHPDTQPVNRREPQLLGRSPPVNVVEIAVKSSALDGVKVREVTAAEVRPTDLEEFVKRVTELDIGDHLESGTDGYSSNEEDDVAAVPVMAGERARRFSDLPREFEGEAGPASQRPSTTYGGGDEDEVEEVAPGKRKVKTPVSRAPRKPIRMMAGREKFDFVGAFRDAPVTGLKWGPFFDLAPSVKRDICHLLVQERAKGLERGKGKGKGKVKTVTIDVGVGNGPAVEAEEEVLAVASDRHLGDVFNFYTKGTIDTEAGSFQVSRILVDAGSVVNLMPIQLLKLIGAKLQRAGRMVIQTATNALAKISYCADVRITIADVACDLRIYALPEEYKPTYPVLLSVTTLRIGSYSGLNSSPYGIPSGNHIEDRPVYLVYYR